MNQRTIKHSISISGPGLHTGKESTIELQSSPLPGIMFLSSNGYGCYYSPESIGNTMMSTVLDGRKFTVSTIEHLMSVIHAKQITNLAIKVDGPEIPILNGAADQFWNMIEAAGIDELEEDTKIKKVIKPFGIEEENGSYIRVVPNDCFSVTYYLDSDIQCIGKQFIYDLKLEEFQEYVYKAKTFGKYEDFENLRKVGLIQGGTLDNAIIYSEKGIILNPETLNYENNTDFVRHKVIDFIGDVYSLGLVHGMFIIKNSGHTLNNKFCREFNKRKGEVYV